MTLTTAEIIEKRSKFADQLNKAGIATSLYSKPPAGASTFIVGRGPGIPGSILLWPGDEAVDIEVEADRKRRQAVLNVDENARTITRKVEVRSIYVGLADAKTQRKTVMDQLIRNFPLGMPEGTKFKVTDIAIEPNGYGTVNNIATYVKATGTVSATTKATKQSFLVGIDEQSYFICALPKRAESVEEAHKILRPAGVKEGTLRQGEFFFVPVAKRSQVAVEKLPTLPRSNLYWMNPSQRNPRAVKGGWQLETGSSHVSSDQREDKGVIYVKGTVKDSRRGHHSTLTLDTWHRVVRNTEVVSPTMGTATAGRPTRRWD